MTSSNPPTSARLATAAGFFLDGFVFANWVSRVPVVQEQLHLSNAVFSVALLSMSLGALITMPPVGRLVAARGSRLGVLQSGLLFSGTLLLPALSIGVTTLSLALLIFGCGFGGMNVTLNAQAVTVEKRYGRPIMSSFHAVFSLGGIAGSVVGSLAAAGGVSPVLQFAIIAPLGLLAAIGPHRYLLADETVPLIAADRPRGRWPFLFLGTIALCCAMGEGSMSDWSAIFLRQISRASPAAAALGFAAFSMTMTLGRALGDRITLAIGPANVVRLGGCTAAGGLLLAMLLPNAVVVIVGFALVGFGLSTIIPTVFSAAGRLPGIAPSISLAAVSTMAYFGFLLGPPIIGVASSIITLRWAIGVICLGCCVAVSFARHVQGTRLGSPSVKPEQIPLAAREIA